MKEWIYKLFKCILRLYTYSFHKWVCRELDFLYTCWLANFFKKVGINTRFERCIFTRGGDNITIGDNCYFHNGNIIDAWEKFNGNTYSPTISIGNNCSFGRYSHISAINKICIGDNLLTGAFVLISDNSHGEFDEYCLNKEPSKRQLVHKGEIIIGNNVWLGDKVAILSGVHVGEGAVVAANAVVTKDVPPYSLVAGVPAKIIKQLNKDE